MDITTRGPVRATLLSWQSQPSLFAVTVISKMTFTLTPGEASVVEDPDPISEEDGHWDDDATKSIFCPGDLAPFKPRCDVMIVGSAFAPEQKPTHAIVAQVVVGELDKAIEVWCDRAFAMDGQLREGRPITRGRLRYERAAGGPGTTNPVGIAPDCQRDPLGMRAVPNLQPLGTVVSKSGDTVLPVGFGPIAASWPDRAGKLRRAPGGFPTPGWRTRPLPEGLDASYFNVAPPDQQLREIRRNERIVLVNLHPIHSRLVTSLPGLEPVVVLERPGGTSETIEVRADTLWIDTDRGLCTVTWRGHVWLRSPNEPGHVTVRVDGVPGSRAAGSPRTQADDAGETLVPFLSSGQPLLPFNPAVGESSLGRSHTASDGQAASANASPSGGIDAASDPASSTIFFFAAGPGNRTLPFDRPAAPDPTMLGTPELPRAVPGSPPPVGAPPVAAARNMAAPETAQPPPVPPQPALSVSAPTHVPSFGSPSASPPMPPPLVEPRREPGRPIGPVIGESRWGAVNRDVAKAMTVGEAAAAAGNVEKERARLPLGEPSAPKLTPPAGPTTPSFADAARAGAVNASNAAAQASQQVESKPLFSFRPALELVWHNPGSLPRIRKNEGWKKLLADLKPRPEEDDLDDDLPAPRRVPAKDRREVLAILARGEPTDADGVEHLLRRALEDEAGFLPPLVLAAGELELQFDELEALKATIASVSPHVGANESLRKTVEGIQEIFKTPFVQGANSVLVDLARRLREAFASVQKGLPSYDLEAHIQATLVDHRHYQKRTAFGQPRLRALFTTPGARAVVPAYLPDTLSKELPGLRRMSVRMIAEVRPRADAGDTGAAALRVLAVGREVG